MLSVYNQTLDPILSQITKGMVGSAMKEQGQILLIETDKKRPKVESAGTIVAEVFYIVMLVAAYAFHLYMMIGPLHFWGDGNLYYISTTVFLVSQTVVSILLLIENYIYVFLPHWIRLGIFIMSLMSIIYWLSECICAGNLYFQALRPSQTLEDIVIIYMVLMNAPQMVPSIFIIVKEITIDDVAIADKMSKEGYQLPGWLQEKLAKQNAAKKVIDDRVKAYEERRDARVRAHDQAMQEEKDRRYIERHQREADMAKAAEIQRQKDAGTYVEPAPAAPVRNIPISIVPEMIKPVEIPGSNPEEIVIHPVGPEVAPVNPEDIVIHPVGPEIKPVVPTPTPAPTPAPVVKPKVTPKPKPAHKVPKKPRHKPTNDDDEPYQRVIDDDVDGKPEETKKNISDDDEDEPTEADRPHFYRKFDDVDLMGF